MNPQSHRFSAGIALIVLVAFANGCAMTPVRQHPDFASAARKVETIAVLPADVSIVRIVFTGDNERLTEQEQTAATELREGLETTLKNKQYTLRPWPTEEQLNANPNARFELEQVRNAYNEAAKQLFDKPANNEEDSRKYRVTLGSIVNPVTTLVDAEALLYVRYAGYERSGGQQAKDIIAGALLGVLTGVVTVPKPYYSELEVSLIDGATGDVLWANRGGNDGPGGLGWGASIMAENVLKLLPGKEVAVAVNDGQVMKASETGASTTPESSVKK